MLPILHLNGYKIANPTVLARIPEEELVALFEGYGYRPLLVSGGFDGEEPAAVHQRFAAALDEALDEIAEIQRRARGARRSCAGPRWPMIVLRTPKGWTGPRRSTACRSRAPGARTRCRWPTCATTPEHLRVLEDWLRSYRPEELFDDEGRLVPELAELAPQGERRMSANPHANGGALLRDLVLPDFRDYAVEVPEPGTTSSEATRVLGAFLRDVVDAQPGQLPPLRPGRDGLEPARRRLRGHRRGPGSPRRVPTDEGLAPDGRVMEILSEHLCQGWLEGYLLTGRHGLFNCYEAFIHIVDSMFNQHAKWLKVTREIPWRRPIASLNYLLSSHVWRQDHNGFSHQDPGFIDHVVNKKAEIIRVYLPPDANTLLSVGRPLPAQPPLRQRDRRRQAAGARTTCRWTTRSSTARAGSASGSGRRTTRAASPTSCSPAAATCRRSRRSPPRRILREQLPDLKVRVVNVVDLMRLQPESEHPHGLSDAEFDSLFTTDTPIVFAYHGYPWLIHRLTYRRDEPRQPPRARLQGGGHDDDAVRHGHAQRPRPLPPRHRRHRPRARARRDRRRTCGRRWSSERLRCARLDARARRGRPGRPRLDLAVLSAGAILVVNAGSTSLKLHLVDE